MSTDGDREATQRVMVQYLLRHGAEDPEGAVDALTQAAAALAKEWGLRPKQLHMITGFNWAKEVSELAAKWRGVGAQMEAAASGENPQEGPTEASRRKNPPLVRGSAPWRKHKRRWEKISGRVIAGMDDKEILDYLRQVDRPVSSGPLAHGGDNRIKLACSRKTLGRTIEAGLMGDFED